jgi:exopolyphosphatase/guanosine-5'-triphosphate,3'-diphosphate pyrophosphatase
MKLCGVLPSAAGFSMVRTSVSPTSALIVSGRMWRGFSWLPVGSARLTLSDLPSDPPAPAELAALRAKLVTLFAEVDPPRPVAAYAVGGSANSIQRLMGVVLDRAALTRGLQILVTRPSAEIAVALGLHADRARLLPAGILLLDAASRAFGAPLLLAGGGLREGVVLEQLAAAGA